MTKKKPQTGRGIQDEISAPKKKQDREPSKAEPMTTATAGQEIAASEDAEADSAQKAGIWAGATKVIGESVGFVGDKAPKVASFVVHKVRKGVSVAYGTSSTFVRDAYRASSEYADEYKHKAEIKKLKRRRESDCASLGETIYTRFVINGESPDKLFADQRITSLLDQIQRLDNEVVEVGKELEKH